MSDAMSDYEQVVIGLDDCRWDHMRVIVDAAADAGESVSAAGWRWLADKARWPTEVGTFRYRRKRKERGRVKFGTLSTGWKGTYAAAFNHPSAWERAECDRTRWEYDPPCHHLPRTVVKRVKELMEPELPRRQYATGDPVPSPMWLAAAAQAVGEWLTAST